VLDKLPLAEMFELAGAFRGNVAEFVGMMERAVRRGTEVRAGEDEDGGVALLTYFRAKGLQWHTVVLTSCNEGLIPHGKAPLEEERRLFYVAMTRASANLVVSYVKNSCNTKVQPSRFLREAGLLT